MNQWKHERKNPPLFQAEIMEDRGCREWEGRVAVTYTIDYQIGAANSPQTNTRRAEHTCEHERRSRREVNKGFRPRPGVGRKSEHVKI